MPSGSRSGAMWASHRQLGERHRRLRCALHRHDAVVDLEVVGVGLEQLRSDLDSFSRSSIAAGLRGAAGDDRGAAAARARPQRRRGGVALDDGDVVDVAAEMGGDDLGDGRLDAVTVAARAEPHLRPCR